jgi:hypothetical protein
MSVRVAFIFITAFWVTMNVLLWRVEYGSQNRGIEVPVNLVWRKVLTAPDSSMLNVFQDGQRIGFCQLTTAVGEEMAKLSDESLPPKHLPRSYKIRLSGNIGLGNFVNRLRFDGELKLASNRTWQELNLKLTSRLETVEIDALGASQTIHLEITEGPMIFKRDLTFADLQNPNTLLLTFGGDFADELLDELNLPNFPQATANATDSIHWEARRINVLIAREPTAVYQVQARLFERYEIVLYVSTLGEILRVELPGGMTASLDEWSEP